MIALCKECDVKYYLLGNGSNILFEDAGYRGVVVDTTALKMGIGFLENVSHPGAEPGAVYDAVIAGAGLKLSALCKAALDSSLTGLEFAYGIPGTVGGAVYMNAGAYGGEMKDVLVSVTYLTREGEIVTEDAANLDLSYRHSIFEENGGCILSAKFHLKRGDSAAIKARMDELMQKRVDKQPLDKPSAGSTFKRPVGAFAAALIDQYFELVAAAREETGDMDARYEAFAAAESFYIDHAIVVPGFISGGSYQATRLNGFEGQYAMMGQSSSRYKGQHVYKTAMSQDMFDAQYAEWTAAMEG